MNQRVGTAKVELPTSGQQVLGDDELLRMLAELLDRAAAGLPSQSPARAATTVAIFVDDPREAEPSPLGVLRLDREPVGVQPGAGAAEAELVFTREDLTRFVHGELQLALAIARGDVGYQGPVRKFLRITPVLRALARQWPSTSRPDDLD